MGSLEPSAKRPKKSKSFQHQWYDEYPAWRTWVAEVPSDSSKFFCMICNAKFTCGNTEIVRHSATKRHLDNLRLKNLENSSSTNVVLSRNDSSPACSQSESSSSSSSVELEFHERVKAAEIRFATLLAQNNISMINAQVILELFHLIGKEPAVLQKMSVGKTKATEIINKVVSPRECTRITDILKKSKFSVFVDETTDITNDKWMTLMVRYVEPISFEVRTELLQLIHLDPTDGTSKRLFDQFKDELLKKEIPLAQIVGLACDNASVMVGNKNSFKIFIEKAIPQLFTIPCICHLLALIAKDACAAIPDDIHNFIANICSFINNSPKRLGLFEEFQTFWYDHPSRVVRFAATRWLSRHLAVSRILKNWDAIHGLLTDQAAANVATADQLLAIMNNPSTKAYLLFLQSELELFNKINAHFQGSKTLVQELQPSSTKFLVTILKKFMKPALLNKAILSNDFHNIDFKNDMNLRPLLEIDIGKDCQDYLLSLQTPEPVIHEVRDKCFEFFKIAAEGARQRLPFDNKRLSDLTVFAHKIALLNPDRATSFVSVKNICKSFNVPSEPLENEWNFLYCIDPDLKKQWCELSFDDMWMKICNLTSLDGTLQFPSLRSLLSIIRALPHSNAAAERAFSIIPDIKTKKRNCLSNETLSSLCVIKSAFKSGNLNALNMLIDRGHIEMMSSSSTLYSKETKASKVDSMKSIVQVYESSDNWTMVEYL